MTSRFDVVFRRHFPLTLWPMPSVVAIISVGIFHAAAVSVAELFPINPNNKEPIKTIRLPFISAFVSPSTKSKRICGVAECERPCSTRKATAPIRGNDCLSMAAFVVPARIAMPTPIHWKLSAIRFHFSRTFTYAADHMHSTHILRCVGLPSIK